MEIGKAPGANGTGRETALSRSEENGVEVGEQVASESSSHANHPNQVHSNSRGNQGKAQEIAVADASRPSPVRIRRESAPPPGSVRECILSAWIAHDPASQALLAQVRRVVSSRASLLIVGEPGVGKDLLASVIHYLGPEPDTPLLRLDCAAFPSDILENELFGHEGFGTWTRNSRGRIEMAGRGTLVLDEIGALTVPVQLRLLRAIEEGRFQPNGSSRFVPNNVRIIALSTSDLHGAVSSRAFLEDFYGRLAVSPIVVPPLRERTGDIPPLCAHFLARVCRLHRRPRMRFSPAALSVFERYAWPGNVSELRALVERLAASFTRDEIGPHDLPAHIAHPNAPQLRPKGSLQELERSYIAEVLDYTRGRKSAAAGILGISRKTLLEKRKRYGLD